MLDLPVMLLLAALVAVAAWFDVRRHRVPNLLVAAGAAGGVLVHALAGGPSGAASSAGGLLLLFVLTFPFFLLGWMGAGDVKLIAAVGAVVSHELALHFLLCIVVSGLVVSLAAFARHGQLGAALSRYRAMIGASLAFRRGVYVEPPAAERIVVPYAIAIAAGSVVGAAVAPWWVL